MKGPAGADVAHAHPACAEGEDPVVEPGEPPGVLRDQTRFEVAVAVPGHGQRDRAGVCENRLG
jgi:hypothetical protein